MERNMVKELIILFIVAIFIRIAVGAINFLITNRKNKIEESKKLISQKNSLHNHLKIEGRIETCKM